MTRRPYILVPAGLTFLIAAVLSGCQTGTPGTAASPTRSPHISEASPAVSPSASPADTRAVAVYYAGNAGPAGTLLYREFHNRPRTDTAIRDAVDAMVNQPPADPDYRSLWPASAQVHRASTSGTVATIDMEAGPTPPTGPAVQQLVWTVTAADRTITRVQILVQGRPLTSAPVGRAASSTILAPVWLLAPASGASLARTFTMSGEATVFEATVSWEVRQGAAVIRHGYTTATNGAPARGSWRVSVTVPAAGSYQVVAFESSAKDGAVLFADSKSVTVR